MNNLPLLISYIQPPSTGSSKMFKIRIITARLIKRFETHKGYKGRIPSSHSSSEQLHVCHVCKAQAIKEKEREEEKGTEKVEGEMVRQWER